jgi:Carboxypeptidase regulatory-like domain
MSLLDHLVRFVRRRPSRNCVADGRSTSSRASCLPTLESLEDRCVPSVTGNSSIASNFNGTSIASGNTLWFSSAFKVNGLGSSAVTLHFTDDTITYSVNGTSYTVDAPDAQVTLSPTATTATTTYNAATNTWTTTLPMKFSGNGFLDGVEVPLTASLPGGIKNVTWQGHFSCDTSGISVNWQWSAAVYTSFSSDYNSLDVKPVDDNHVSTYRNSDHAGTPEAYLAYVIGGATGGGGSNFTGSLSGTASVTSTTLATLSGFVTDTSGAGISGLAISLSTTNAQGQTVTYTATTDSNGFYSFSGLSGGTYALSVTSTSTFNDVIGSVNGTTSGSGSTAGTIGNIGLTAGGVGLNYDFQQQPTVVNGS